MSHQLPVLAVFDVVIGFGVDAVGAKVEMIVVASVVVLVCVVVVVDVLQDAKTIDVAMRQVSNIHLIPLFIFSSQYVTENFWKLTIMSFLEYSFNKQILIGKADLATKPRLPSGLRTREGHLATLS